MKLGYIAAVFMCAVIWAGCDSAVRPAGSGGVKPVDAVPVDEGALAGAFKDKRSNVQVEGEGVVARVLADDNDGSRHQRFVLRLASGQTVLIAHNIDIAPRIAELKRGDSVRFHGEYVWNEEGGVVHWTHHDPEGRHTAGWLKHNGRTYQ